MTAWVETELKLALPDEAAWSWVRNRLGPGEIVEQANHFFDGPERAFALARVGIRLRSDGTHRLLTVKGETGQSSLEPVTRRIELEASMPAAEFDRALARGLDLAPWIGQWRKVRPEHPHEGQEFESFLDQVERLSKRIILERYAGFDNRRETLELTLHDGIGPIELEIELDRTVYPGGRVDFEIEVERTSERDESMTRTHRALTDWLSEEGRIQTAPTESKLARLHALLDTGAHLESPGAGS